jgi:hypothetical protein
MQNCRASAKAASVVWNMPTPKDDYAMVTGQVLNQLVINALPQDIVHRQVPNEPGGGFSPMPCGSASP